MYSIVKRRAICKEILYNIDAPSGRQEFDGSVSDRLGNKW
jgi:hypothetical protein